MVHVVHGVHDVPVVPVAHDVPNVRPVIPDAPDGPGVPAVHVVSHVWIQGDLKADAADDVYDVDDDVDDDDAHDDATILIRSRLNVIRVSGRGAWEWNNVGECEKYRLGKNSMPRGVNVALARPPLIPF